MDEKCKLTPQQQAFADYYIESSNALDSAKRAGYKQPHAQGSRLLENVRIKAYIADRVGKMSKKRIATAEEVLEFLTRGMKQELEEEVVSFDMGGKVLRTTKKNTSKEAIKCAELLGKRYALFTDNQNVNASVGVVVVNDIGE
ncbi:MAG: terminase small subunit [Sarcina sp.]